MENQIFKDFAYVDHPCENLNFIDDIIYSEFSKEQIIEEYCFHASKDEVLNRKKYYIFQIHKIKNKKILFDMLKKVIKHLNLKNFKNDIYDFVNKKTGINLNNFILLNINKKIIKYKMNHFIIKVDQNNNFSLYIASETLERHPSVLCESISIKNNILINKLYVVTKYKLNSTGTEPEYLWLNEINLDNNTLESQYEPSSIEFDNKNFTTSYLTKEFDGSKGFYYLRIAYNKTTNKLNKLRIYFN
jgi:hypothetical protein